MTQALYAHMNNKKKKKENLSLFTDNNIIYVENLTESTEKLLELESDTKSMYKNIFYLHYQNISNGKKNTM
jgi:hypothetical protein